MTILGPFFNPYPMNLSFKTNFHEMETWQEWLPEELLHTALLNTLTEGVLLLRGTKGTVISANKKAGDITGFDLQQLIGQPLTAIVKNAIMEDGSPMVAHEFPALIALRNGAAGQPVVVGFKTKGGKTTWFSVKTTFLKDQAPALAGLIAVTFCDVTPTKEASQMGQALIAEQDMERTEIARELQDNVNQILSSVSIMLSAAKGNPDEQDFMLHKASEYLNMAIQEVRKLSRSLNGAVINEVGLRGPVEDIIKNMQEQQPLTVDFTCSPALEEELTADMQLMLYRIIQEQTNNILRFAQASHVQIAMHHENGFVTLLIQDNGKGFNVNKQPKGMGLMNILNRAEAFGGTLQLVTQPGKGVRLVVKVPVVLT